jgi:predicted PurR-regulated permease PerM
MRQERLFFTLLFAAIAVLGVAIMKPFLTYIVLAGILTYTLFPVYRFILKRTKRPQLSSALSILVTLIIMVLPAVYLVTELVGQVTAAYNSLKLVDTKRVAEYLTTFTGDHIKIQPLMDSALEQTRQAIVGVAPDVLGSISGIVLGLFIMFFVMFYAFRDGEAFLNNLKRILPLDKSLKDSLFYEVRTVTQAVLYGQVITALIQGTLGGIGMYVAGVPNAIFWGVVMMFTAFIPLLGTPVVWVPAAIDQIRVGHTAPGVGLLIFGALVVVNIDNFLRPRLVSGRTNVHPVLILIGALGGLKLFGFIGLLVGPLVLAVLMALIKFYETAYSRKPQLDAH